MRKEMLRLRIFYLKRIKIPIVVYIADRADKRVKMLERKMMEIARYLDPSTAPNLPIITTIEWKADRSPAWEVIIEGWDRQTDKKIVYKIQVDNLEFTTEELDTEDKLWLANIGARKLT